MTTYAYLRVSTDKQDYDNQRTGILTYCQQHNLHIDKEIVDDGVSGTTSPEERKLGKILQHIKKDDTIICSELSRLGRKLFMIMKILEHCMNVGATVYTVKEQYILGNTLESTILAFAFGLSAEIERNLISARTREALAHKKSTGIKLGRPKGSPNKYSKLTPKHDTIKQLLKTGISRNTIAKKLNVSFGTINRYIKEKL